jgi:hypothetical protein
VKQLVNFLDEPDPRAPVVTRFDNRTVPVVRELVRINHHRNCLLCHAPGTDNNTVSGAVPLRDQPLPPPSQYYQFGPGIIVVRADVTYLRPDFSVMQRVPDAKPWPEMQRFDFVVRTRPLSFKEAEAYHRTNKSRLPGPSANHRAALTALRGLTGLDTEANAAAWRRALGQ